MYIISWISFILIHLAKKAQITFLFIEKVKISAKYSNFSNIFLKKTTLVLPKIISLNQYIIELQKSQQPFYRPIYSLELVELKY